MTGGRIKRIQNHITDNTFMITYGDGLSDVHLTNLLDFHNKKNKKLTITAVNPDGRFGLLGIKEDLIYKFHEKPKTEDGWVNGGFMVADKEIFNYLTDDSTILERKPLESLANEGQLSAFKHNGFWQPMDTLRDKQLLEKFLEENKAPWIR
jgi:glucose-1-phosphate cytidylyltransferase